MRSLLLALTLLFAIPAALAQGGVADMFRSLSGALRGGKEAPPPQQQGATTTMGVRGIDEVDNKATGPASGDYALMEGWTASKAEAAKAAEKKHLAARQAILKKPDEAAPTGGNPQ